MMKVILASALLALPLTCFAQQRPEATASPEAVTYAYVDAMMTGRVDELAPLMHPEALAQFRDAVLVKAGFTMKDAGGNGKEMLMRVFGVGDLDSLRALDAARLYTSLMSQMMERETDTAETRSAILMMGHVNEGTDSAHVVFQLDVAEYGYTSSILSTLIARRNGDRWGMMLPQEIASMIEVRPEDTMAIESREGNVMRVESEPKPRPSRRFNTPPITTPEGTAALYLRALSHDSIAVAAGYMDRHSLDSLRATLMPIVDAAGSGTKESLRSFLESFGMEDLFEMFHGVSSLEALKRLDSRDFYTAFRSSRIGRTSEPWAGLDAEIETIGHVMQGDTAHVVYRMMFDAPMPGQHTLLVASLRRGKERWEALPGMTLRQKVKLIRSMFDETRE